MLEPLTKGDERHPGVVNVPIQITISPVSAVLKEDIDVTVTVVGGTASGKKCAIMVCTENLNPIICQMLDKNPHRAVQVTCSTSEQQ